MLLVNTGIGRILGGLVLLLLTISPCQGSNVIVTGEEVRLAWNPVTEPGIAGYRIFYGTVSGVYPETLDVGNTTSTSLTGLTYETPYFAVVAAYSFAGLESTPSSEICFTLVPPSGHLVFVEPEEGVLVLPMYIGADFFDSSSGNQVFGPSSKYVIALEDNQEGSVAMTFDAPATANYYAWCRVKAPSPAADSFLYSIDGGPEDLFEVHGASPPGTAYSENWVWTRIKTPSGEPMPIPLFEGPHSMEFRNREANTALEVVVLTSDPAFVPAGSIPREGDVIYFTTFMNNEFVIEGGGTELSVSAVSNDDSLSYQWYKDGEMLEEMNDPSLQLDEFGAAQEGTYSVTVTSDDGTVITQTVTVELPFQVRFIESFPVGPSQFILFHITGELGSLLDVHASTDLRSWELLDTQTNSSGQIVVNDPEAIDGIRRFYKLSAVQP